MDVVLRVIPFFLLIAVGAGLARARLVDLAGARALSTYVFWVAFPALLIHSLSHAPAPDAKLALSLAAYVAAATAPLVVAFVAGRLTGWSREERAGAAMASVVGNTAFLGAPLAVALFGARAGAPAAAVVAMDCSIIMIIASAALRGAAGEGGWARTARLVAGHPLILAAILGLVMAFAGVTAPGPIDQVLALLRATASPVGLVALGVVLGLEAGHWSRREAGPVVTAVALKILLTPLLVWLALGLVGADPLFRAVATLLAACPAAVSVFIQTRTAGVFAKGGAMAVVLATLLCVITLPLLGALLRPGG